jgi:hypothetical protein
MARPPPRVGFFIFTMFEVVAAIPAGINGPFADGVHGAWGRESIA